MPFLTFWFPSIYEKAVLLAFFAIGKKNFQTIPVFVLHRIVVKIKERTLKTQRKKIVSKTH